ncbi:hypothetical protein GW17_00045877 [Ensete ventricosum]|nr:hypothetical protein GW17_00045877 [Ensete ventricosum]
MAQGSSLKEDRDSSEDYRGSLGDSPKESGSSLGTQREIAEKKTGGLAARSLEVVGLCGMSDGWIARTTEFERRAIAFGG